MMMVRRGADSVASEPDGNARRPGAVNDQVARKEQARARNRRVDQFT